MSVRVLSVSLIAVGLALIASVVVIVNSLRNLAEPFVSVDVQHLARGRIHELLAVPEVWHRGLTTAPDLMSFVNPMALVTTTVLVALCAGSLHRLDRWSWLGFGLSALWAESMAYINGYLWLAAGNVTVESCGPWLAWMLMSMLYGALIGIIAGVFELCRSPQPSPRRTAPRERLVVTGPARSRRV